MTYVVTENCIRCKYMDCVEVCPVDCFYVGENMLVIKPDECIDCGVCEPECPAEAIVPDSDDKAAAWAEQNRKYSERCGRTSPARASRRRMPMPGKTSRTRQSCSRPSLVRDLLNKSGTARTPPRATHAQHTPPGVAGGVPACSGIR